MNEVGDKAWHRSIARSIYSTSSRIQASTQLPWQLQSRRMAYRSWKTMLLRHVVLKWRYVIKERKGERDRDWSWEGARETGNARARRERKLRTENGAILPAWLQIESDECRRPLLATCKHEWMYYAIQTGVNIARIIFFREITRDKEENALLSLYKNSHTQKDEQGYFT